MSDSSGDIVAFWERVRTKLPHLPEAVPEAWAFGATPEMADELLALVLRGTKTATASSLWEYEHDSDPLPEPGSLSILLDGTGAPRAIIETTDVKVVPFNEVDETHAYEEGEGDRTLDYWRKVHEHYWRSYSPRFEPDMPAVCEKFRLLHPTSDPNPV
ncbi:ASCH domain-containing protein [Actinomycetaceae bacterium MB13-C1-2]|nr:ASCH domain-containing protein [Actinomycetaceae bacterium MB13-C1-2]